MEHILIRADDLISPLRHIADKIASPLLYLGFRLYLAAIFFRSGWGRLQDYINGSWDTQIFLFEMEHPVPGLDPAFAAAITTGAELVLPVLLVLGLFTRLGAAGVFIMALVIQLTYLDHFQHLLWITMAVVILIKGPGFISLDYFLVRRIRKKRQIQTEKSEPNEN